MPNGVGGSARRRLLLPALARITPGALSKSLSLGRLFAASVAEYSQSPCPWENAHEGERRTDVKKPAKNTVCLWYDRDAEDAARFYAETFPDSSVTAVHRAPGDFPSGKQGDVLTVEFTVCGVPCLGLNGGPEFKPNESFSFQIATDDQAETDRYWNAIVSNGGKES